MGYEYCDHPADVILHTWGKDINEAIIESAKGMFGFMTDLNKIELKEKRTITVDADSYEDALVKFLDNWLCIYSSEMFIGKEFKYTVFDDEDEDHIHIECECLGETFVLGKHTQGTEIKAITWHDLELYDEGDQTHIRILLDI